MLSLIFLFILRVRYLDQQSIARGENDLVRMTSHGPEQAVVKINHLKGFITVLQAIKPSNNKQVCTCQHLHGMSRFHTQGHH